MIWSTFTFDRLHNHDNIHTTTLWSIGSSSASGVFQKAGGDQRKKGAPCHELGYEIHIHWPDESKCRICVYTKSKTSMAPWQNKSATTKIGLERAFNLRPPFVRFVDLLVYCSGLDMDVRAILRPSNHDVEMCLYCGSRHLQGTDSSTGVGHSEAKDKQSLEGNSWRRW